MVAPVQKSGSVLDSDDSDSDDDDNDSDLESVLSEASTTDNTPNPKKIYIDQLPAAATRQDLKGIFAPHGNLSDIVIFNKRRGIKSIPCAILTFDDEESVKTILANTPYFFGQFKLNVKENRNKHSRNKAARAEKAGRRNREPKSKQSRQDKKNAAAAGDSKNNSKENKSGDAKNNSKENKSGDAKNNSKDNKPSDAKNNSKDNKPSDAKNNSRENKPEFDDNCKLFVGGIPTVATEEELRKIFKDYGPLVEIKLRPPKLATQKFAYAFVTYANKACVAKVMKDKPIKYYNYTTGPTCTILNVTEHKSKEENKQNATPSASKDSFVLVNKSELGKQPKPAELPRPVPPPRPQQQPQQQQQQQQPRGLQQPPFALPRANVPPTHQGPSSPTLYPALTEVRDTINAIRNGRPPRQRGEKAEACCLQ